MQTAILKTAFLWYLGERDDAKTQSNNHPRLNPLKRMASAFPLLAAGLASEYDKEDILALRYPAVLPQGSSFYEWGALLRSVYLPASKYNSHYK